jgi:hypothetical protein
VPLLQHLITLMATSGSRLCFSGHALVGVSINWFSSVQEGESQAHRGAWMSGNRYPVSTLRDEKLGQPGLKEGRDESTGCLAAR